MCGQRNVRASAGDSTGQNTDKGQTPNLRIGIKIPDPAENQTRAAGLEGSDSSDHATATDSDRHNIIIIIQLQFIISYCSNYLFTIVFVIGLF